LRETSSRREDHAKTERRPQSAGFRRVAQLSVSNGFQG
jgi:hypothetical protein